MGCKVNERQQKLKSILDRYAACTLTLEEGEKELAIIFANDRSFDVLEATTLDTSKWGPTKIYYGPEEMNRPLATESQPVINSTAADVDDRPVMYLEVPSMLLQKYEQALREEWNRAHNGKVRLVVLPPGSHLVNQHGYEPSRIAAKVGAFDLESKGLGHWEATFDGETIRPHKKLTFVMEVGKAPLVTIEYVPLAQSKDS